MTLDGKSHQKKMESAEHNVQRWFKYFLQIWK